MAEDAIVKSICRGQGRQFGNKICEYYQPAEQICTLLKEKQPLHTVFEKGRCRPLEMVKAIVRIKLYKKYRHCYQEFADNAKNRDELTKDIPTIVFLIVENYLKPQHLSRGATLTDLKRYIQKIASCKIVNVLQEIGRLAKRFCRECTYLPQNRPFICRYYNEKRRPSDNACEEGFERELPQPEQTVTPIEIESPLKQGTRLLAERAEKTPAKDQQKYDRQYHVFVRVLQLYRRIEKLSGENESIAQAIRMVAQESAVSINIPKNISVKDEAREKAIRRELLKIVAAEVGVSTKTITRDLEEISQFFKEQHVL